MDFMHDALYCGRRLRTLNMIEESWVHRFLRRGVLTRLIDCYGAPDAIRLDNGLEMVSQAFTEWAVAKGIAIRDIQPGKPNQNAFIKHFNRTYRTEVLDIDLFANLEQVHVITDQRLVDYNEYRPREALGGIPPIQFMPRLNLAPNID